MFVLEAALVRPTALIRRILQLEYLQAELARQVKAVKQELRNHGISIIETEHRPLDIRVQYQVNGRHYEALFMSPMLRAEVEGVFRRWLGEKRE